MPANDPFTRFAHPQEGGSIQRGSDVPVTAAAMFAEPPADGKLEFSEDSGNGWNAVAGFVIAGRAIHGTYKPTGGQASIVKFRTNSASAAWFRESINVFVV